jgi:hypothetical protein
MDMRFLTIIAGYVFILYIFLEYKNKCENYVYVPNTTEWFNTEIEVRFNDGTKQNYKIDVYKNLDNIKVNDGDLSYIKCTKKTGGTVAYKVELASFVKNYIVVSSEFKTKTE